jgi:hypothetical protein
MANTFETKDKEYLVTRFKFIVDGAMLRTRAYECTGKRIKGLEIEVDMSKTTALRIINIYPNYGRHFEDGVLRAFKESGCPLGFVTPILRGA